MLEDKIIAEEQFSQAMAAPPRVVVYERPRGTTGFHFVDQLSSRGAHARRHAVADGGFLYRPLHHQRQAPARDRGGAAGRSGAI